MKSYVFSLKLKWVGLLQAIKFVEIDIPFTNLNDNVQNWLEKPIVNVYFDFFFLSM